MSNLLDNDITAYCELITNINEVVIYLNSAAADFYEGGHSFEEVYETDLKMLEEKQQALKELLQKISKS